ncbi:MAG: hypothetical protein V4671_23685 [Armatimonadota bacterium]
MRTLSNQKRGPLATPGRVRVTVYLDESLADWGKQQQGGLSGLIRRLLANAYSQEGSSYTPDYPLELRAAYNRLIDQKLSTGLSPEEEAELADVRGQINTWDRQKSTWNKGEQSAYAVDRALADLRREIEALPPRL